MEFLGNLFIALESGHRNIIGRLAHYCVDHPEGTVRIMEIMFFAIIVMIWYINKLKKPKPPEKKPDAAPAPAPVTLIQVPNVTAAPAAPSEEKKKEDKPAEAPKKSFWEINKFWIALFCEIGLVLFVLLLIFA